LSDSSDKVRREVEQLRRRISELELAQDALRASEARCRDLVRNTPAVLWTTDQDGHTSFISPNVARVYGYAPDEILRAGDKLWLGRVHSRDLPTVKNTYAAMMETGTPYDVEYRIQRKDGAWIWLHDTAARSYEVDGTMRADGVFMDITERKQQEENLRREHEFSKRLIDTAPIIVLLLDTRGHVVWFNSYMAKLTGHSLEEALGKDWISTFLPERHRTRSRELFEEAVHSTFPQGSVNPILARDGRELVIEWHATTLTDADGSTEDVLAMGLDITGRRRAEEERRGLEEQIHRTQKLESLGLLAGGIAHDFNNILGAQIGYTDLAMDSIPADSEAHHFLEEADRASMRARDLVAQVLAFSRQGGLEHKPIRIRRVVQEAMSLLRKAVPRTVEFDCDFGHGRSIVLADATQIHQVIMNLGTNANHAMRDHGGTLALSLDETRLEEPSDPALAHLPEGLYARLTVTDSGHGMSEDLSARIFEPYFTTKKVGEGTGLGLATVLGIVQKHGGAITVHSTQGEGTTFTVYLPLHGRAEASDVSPDSRRQEVPRGRGEHILIIDDEAPMVALQKSKLERLGYVVTEHTASRDALRIFRADPGAFDLVVTDHTMPDMTGMELAAEMLRIRPDLKIILCTGFSESASREDALAIGIHDHIMKPTLPGDLAERIRQALDESGPAETRKD
jgi:PAS domain S-box-containing protein